MKYVVGWLTLKPGQRDAFIARVRPFVQLSRSEAGVRIFEVAASDTDPDVTVWVEGYDSEETHQQHRARAEHQAFLADIAELAVGGRFTHIRPADERTDVFSF